MRGRQGRADDIQVKYDISMLRGEGKHADEEGLTEVGLGDHWNSCSVDCAESLDHQRTQHPKRHSRVDTHV